VAALLEFPPSAVREADRPYRRKETVVMSRPVRSAAAPSFDAPLGGAGVGRALVAAILCGSALAAAAFAIGQGRVVGTILDGSGAPIAMVKVVITSPEMATFRLEKVTDGHGQFNAILLDATRQYRIRFEKAGYETVEQPLKPKIEDTLKETYTLQSSETPANAQRDGMGAATPGPSAPSPAVGAAAGSAPAGAGAGAARPNPEAVKAHNEGVAALKAKDTGGAVAKLEEAERLDPKLAAAPAVLADLYLDLKRPGDAVAAADRALALEPGKPRLMLVRFQALRAAGDKPRAAQALDELVAHPAPEVARDVAVFLYNDAADATRDKHLDAAVADLKRALLVDPTLEPAYGALTNIDVARQDYKAALEVADRWVAATPQSPQALQVRYQVLTKLNDPHAAEAKAAMDSARGAAASPLNHGIELYNANRIAEATKAFEAVVAADPQSAKAQYMLGLCYVNSGDLVRARASLEAFLKLAPDDPEAATARQMLKELQ
jgi:tetratricopeptide (TPR) repeat protein